MSYTNAPIIDLLVQIKNAYLARKLHIEGITSSGFKLKVLELLKKAKFIADFRVVAEGNKKSIEIDLLDSSNMNEVVPQVKLFSKPSRRHYVGYEEIKGVAGGRGVGLISTDKGLMFTHEAKAKKLGGELIAELY